MMSQGSKLLDGKELVSIVLPRQQFNRFKAQMAMISSTLQEALRDLQDSHWRLSRLEAVFVAAQDSQAKPSKKRPRTAKPRTSTLPKA